MFSKVLSVVALATAAFANDKYPISRFQNDPAGIAQSGSPQWNFPSGTCMPSPAKIDGHQNPGNAQDNCNIGKLNNHCPAQPRELGSDTHMWSFPTYWDLRRCNDNQFRVAYNVYFTKDTGHRHDIEWVIVVFNSIDGGRTFDRSEVIFEQDGTHARKPWSQIQNTFFNQDDQLSLGKQNSNHARIFVSKWHHSMHDDRYTQFKNTCPPNSGADYRTNTFYFWSSDNLVHVDDIPSNWDYGHASFARGQDICSK